MADARDVNGAELKVGDKVMLVGSTDPRDEGVVIGLNDADGDTDDYGRSIGIPASVVVEFHDCEDSFACQYDWRDGWWCCEDVQAVTTSGEGGV